VTPTELQEMHISFYTLCTNVWMDITQPKFQISHFHFH